LRREISDLKKKICRMRLERDKIVEEASKKAAAAAAKAFKDVRLNAEKQFGWLFQRLDVK
jgi:hypothetical protein